MRPFFFWAKACGRLAEKKTDPKDPRFRRFRQAAYGLYLVVVVTVCAWLIISVYRSTYDMTFGHPAPAEKTISVKECVDGANGLFSDLEAERKKMSDPKVSEADQRWLAFRKAWIGRYRTLEAQCALESHNRESVKVLFKELEKISDLYLTHAVQFAGEVGPTVDGFRERLTELRKDPAFGKLP